jgi:hypothetical protein
MISQEAIGDKVSKEVLRVQMDIQIALMDRMRPSGEDITKSGIEWTEMYSAEFAKLFEKKITDNPNFIENCKTSDGLKSAVDFFEEALASTTASGIDTQRMAA